MLDFLATKVDIFLYTQDVALLSAIVRFVDAACSKDNPISFPSLLSLSHPRTEK